MNVTASFMVSAILSLIMTTDSRRRQKAAAASFSVCTKLFLVGMMPIANNLTQASTF